MSKTEFYLKRRKSMSKPGTNTVKIGNYTLTSHAQNNVVLRNVKKKAVVDNLIKEPVAIKPVKKDVRGMDSYQRKGKRATVVINPQSNNVITLWANCNDGHTKKGRKINAEKKARSGRKH